MTRLKNGAEIIIDANQWQENGYKVVEGHIVSYYIDRKDPQYSEGKAMTYEEFIQSSGAELVAIEWAKTTVIR